MSTVILAVFATILIICLHARYSRRLNQFNGPFLASITDLWKIWYQLTNSQKRMYADMHEKYGDIVRVGPNELSFADPQAIRDIYGPGGSSQKSKEYDVTAVPVEGEPMQDIFPALNTEWHDEQRRILSSAFTMTEMVKHESLLDRNITLFIKQLRKRFEGSGVPMDLMEWLEYFSLEWVFELTFGEHVGYVEEGRDVNEVLSGVNQMMATVLWLWCAPVLDQLTIKNPLLLWFNRHGWFLRPNPYFPLVTQKFHERHQYWEEDGRRLEDQTLTDILLRKKMKHPDFDAETHSTMVIAAAGVGNAITTSSIIYYLCNNPASYLKLKEELDTKLPSGPVSFAVAKDLPYLNAVIDESMRCHVTVRLTSPRETPKDGLQISGRWVPPGVSVSICATVVQHRKEVFGDDAEVFRPERWLEDKDKVQRMRNAMFTFGSGKFMCLGRNIAKLEILKLVPRLLREFDFSLVEEGKKWTLAHGVFAAPIALKVYVRPRK